MIGEAAEPEEAPTQIDTPTIAPATTVSLPPEFGGREGPEPTRYGDWEKKGRCIDF